MIGITEEERGTDDRGKSSRGAPRVDFVHLRGTDARVKALVRVLPKEPLLLDEVSIKPSERWQNQEARQQAKRVLAQAKEGKRVSENDVIKLQQRLLGTERQGELSGRTSEGRELATALGELRRSNLVAETLGVLARAKKGGHVPEGYVTKLQQRLLGMEHQDESFGRASEGQQLALELGEVRRSNLVAEASDVLARAKEGRRFPRAYVTKLQQRLLGMEHQDEFFGRASEGRELATALGEVQRSRLVAEALHVVAQMKEGRRFSQSYVTKLQQLLVGMERQDEILGRPSEGLQLASALAEHRQ
jgi:hypothetical protein